MLRLSSLIITLVLVISCTANDERSMEERTARLTVAVNERAVATPAPSATLKAITLNIAHGRDDSLNQWLVSEEQTRENLDEIARFLQQSGADVVALQEADTASRWSGNFDHTSSLAEKAGFRYYVHAEHARIWMGNYGTAILSRWPIKEAIGLNYADTPPTGFIKRFWAWIILLFMGVAWGFTVILAKVIVAGGAHPFGVAMWTSALGAGFLLACSAARRRPISFERDVVRL